MKKTSTRKPSKSEVLTEHTVRNHKDFSTYEVTCRVMALDTAILDIAVEEQTLNNRLRMLRTRRESLKAEALGLEQILDSRR